MTSGENPKAGSTAKTIDVLDIGAGFVSIADAANPIATLQSKTRTVVADSNGEKRGDVDDVAGAAIFLQIGKRFPMVLQFIGRRSFGKSHYRKDEKRSEKNCGGDGMKRVGGGAEPFGSSG